MRSLLLVALIACGDDAATPDGGLDGDAMIDADPNVRGSVTVRIVDIAGTPLPGMHAVFIDTDATVTDAVTDSAGVATASVFPGASVTAVRARDTGMAYSLTTVQSLVPGDTVELISAAPSAASSEDPFSNRVVSKGLTPAGTFTINYPAAAGATNYLVVTSCEGILVGNTTSAPMSFYPGCITTPMDVFVIALTSPRKFIEQRNVTFTAGGSTTIPGTWQDMALMPATYSNTTSRVTNIELERFGPYVRGAPASISGMPSGGQASMMVLAAANGRAVMRSRFQCPPGAATDCVSSMVGVAQQQITHAVDGSATSYALDVGANLLPWISALYDPATTTLQMTTTGTGAIDLYEANIRYTRGQVIYTWRVFGAVPGNFTFPALPSTIPGDPTVRSDDAQSAYQVFLCESDAINGYRDAIKNVYTALGTCEQSSNPAARTFDAGTMNRLSYWN